MRYRVVLQKTGDGNALKGVAAYFRRRSGALDQASREAEQKAAEEARKILYELSSGPYSSRRLAELGHPYRLGGTPPDDPAVINKQSGDFRDAWVVDPPRKRGEGLSTRIVNTMPYAVYLLGGTKNKMIPRPILTRLQERLAPVRARLWRERLVKQLAQP